MNIVYYYPPKAKDALTALSQDLFEEVYKKRDEIEHELTIFYCDRDKKRLENKFSDSKIINIRNIHKMKDSIIHFFVPLVFFPNSKFLLYLLGKATGNKILLNVHGDYRFEMKYRFNFWFIPHYILYPYILKSASQIIVNSFRMSEVYRGNYSINNDIIIPNGIEDWWFKQNSSTISLEGDPTIFFHGKLSSEKGVLKLIKGFAKSANKHSILYIAGDGPQRDYLKANCIKLGIDKKVKFLGVMERETIKSYIENVDTLIYPSLFESFSLAILEAFSSANAPVYYSNLAGINDFVLRDGYHFNSFYPTVENIADIIEMIIEKNYDQKVVHKQKKFATSYRIDKITDQYIKLYNQYSEL